MLVLVCVLSWQLVGELGALKFQCHSDDLPAWRLAGDSKHDVQLHVADVIFIRE
jgi:hypothetical protein